MRRYIKLTLIVSVLGIILLLTGCDLGLVGDIVIPGGNSTDSIQGTIVEANDFTWSEGETLPLTYLVAGEKLIIAITPFDSSTLQASDYSVKIAASTSSLSAKSVKAASTTGRLLNLQRKPIALPMSEEVVVSDQDQESLAVEEDRDYFTYDVRNSVTTADSNTPQSLRKEAQQPELMAALQSGTRTFFVRTDASVNSYKTVNASLVKASSNLEIYLSSDASVSSNIIDKMASEFDWNIYQKVTNFMGTPFDKDGNDKTIILIAPLVFNGSSTKMVGYFDEVNLFDKTGNNYSNEADMFYMNSHVVAKGDMTQLYSNLAHEFAHLVFASQKYRVDPYGIRFSVHQYSDRWLNEGCAMLASHLAGYASLSNDWRIYDRSYGYFGSPQRDGLLVWETSREESNYGSAALFTYYLYEHYRSDFRSVLTTSGKVEVAIDNYMNDFSQIMRDWMLTNLGDRLKGYAEYHYQNLALKSSPALKTVTGAADLKIRGMGVQYIVIDGPVSNLDLTLTYTTANILNAGYMIVRTQ